MQRGGAPITLIEAAASEAPGTAMLHEYDEPYVNALAKRRGCHRRAPPPRRSTSSRSMTSVRAEQLTPTFIRMDVQGAEWHVLRGARETIRNAGPDLVIVAEMHPQCWPGFGVDAQFALDTIALLRLDADAARAWRRALCARRSRGVHAGANTMTVP